MGARCRRFKSCHSDQKRGLVSQRSRPFCVFGQIPVFDVCLRHTKSCFAFSECSIPTKNEDLSHRDQVLFAFLARFQSLTYAFGIPNLVSPLANVPFRPKKQLSLVVWLLFCLVCQFETVRVANAGSHTAGITKRSVVTLSFRPKNTVEKDTFSAVFLSIAKAMAYHHDLACISSPQAYIISRRLYSLSQ